MNIRKIVISTFIVSFGLFIGRVSGFFREILIANTFGASVNSDFIVLLLTTPDFIVSLLMGGAMSMALIPEFKRLDNLQGQLLFQQISTLLIAFSIGLLLLLFLFSHEIISHLALGMDSDFINNNEIYFFYSLLALPFSLVTGASLAYLNAQEKFKITSLGTLIVNVSIIISIFLAYNRGGGFLYISVGLIIAALLRWLSHIASIRTFPFCFFYKKDTVLINKELIQRYIYALVSGGIIYALPVVIRTISSLEGEGIMSLVNYSIKLVELPLIILSTAFSIVLLPWLSKVYVNGDEKSFVKSSSLALIIVMFTSIIVMIPLNFHSKLATEIVYGWGILSSSQLHSISQYLTTYSLSLPFQCVNGVLLAIFSSRRDTKSPFLITTLLGLGFFAFLFLVRPNVAELLNYIVVFYCIMTLCFVVVMKVKHKFWIFSRNRGLTKAFLGYLIAVFFIFKITKKSILSLPPSFGVVVVISLVCSMLLISLFMFKKIGNGNS